MVYKVQYNDDREITLGEEATYQDLERDKMVSFSVLNNDKLIFKLHLDETKRLIWRKRIIQKIGRGTEEITLCGWQKKVGEENIQSIAFIFEDGHIEMAGAWGKHAIFGEVKLMDYEL